MVGMAEADDHYGRSVAITNTDEIRAPGVVPSKNCDLVPMKALSDGEVSEYKTAVQCRASAAEPQGSHLVVGSTYVTARRRKLEELRSHRCSENEMEKSPRCWKEVGGPSSDLDLLHVANRQHFETLSKKYYPLFRDYGRDDLVVGRKVNEGGQASIFEALIGDRPCILKVFQNDYLLADLERLWTLTDFYNIESNKCLLEFVGIRYSSYCCFINAGTLLKDGSFAFVMERYWGDLRSLIDLRMEENNHQGPPFQYPIIVMLQIARGMRFISYNQIVHRDLKAANVLLGCLEEVTDDSKSTDEVRRALRAECFGCYVADFDSAKGAMGTTFWRPPEVVRAIRQRRFEDPRTWTEKTDVYSYAMTCYEILTGRRPSDEHMGHRNEYDAVVVQGRRPPLPDYIDHRVQKLLKRCWHPEPSKRPKFHQIVEKLESLMHTVPAQIRPVHLEPWHRLLGDNSSLDEIITLSTCTILPWLIPALYWEEGPSEASLSEADSISKGCMVDLTEKDAASLTPNTIGPANLDNTIGMWGCSNLASVVLKVACHIRKAGLRGMSDGRDELVEVVLQLLEYVESACKSALLCPANVRSDRNFLDAGRYAESLVMLARDVDAGPWGVFGFVHPKKYVPFLQQLVGDLI